jgi:hypothetical protein
MKSPFVTVAEGGELLLSDGEESWAAPIRRQFQKHIESGDTKVWLDVSLQVPHRQYARYQDWESRNFPPNVVPFRTWVERRLGTDLQVSWSESKPLFTVSVKPR